MRVGNRRHVASNVALGFWLAMLRREQAEMFLSSVRQ
jgi:hypothetical protein